jgi:hypothetical protein
MTAVASHESRILAIPPQEVDQHWAEFLPLLIESSSALGAEFAAQAAERIRALARGLERQPQLWLVRGTPLAAITRLSEDGLLGRTCAVWPLWGSGFQQSHVDRIAELLAQIEDGARRQGCASLEVHYSPASEPNRDGFRKSYEVFSKDLRGRLS